MSEAAATTSDERLAVPQDDAAWDTADVCRYLKLAKASSVLALVRSGRLPAVRLGKRYRFAPAAVRAFLEGPPPGRVRRARGKPAWLEGVPQTIRRG